MSSVKLPRSLAGLALGAVMVTACPAIAETLVVRASGPSAGSFSPGKRLPEGKSVTLKAGDVLTLLDGRGTRTLRGPGAFGTGASATGGGGSSIASFIGTRTTARSRTGAVRSGLMPTAPRRPNLWYVDMSKQTTACVPDPTNIKLWRPASADAGTVVVAGKGVSGKIAFEAGQSLVEWPVAELPVTEGISYQLSGGGLAKPVTIRFTILAPSADGLEGTASTLIARKCDAQLDLLIETVALPDPAPDIPS
jgi:hypothetical protein